MHRLACAKTTTADCATCCLLEQMLVTMYWELMLQMLVAIYSELMWWHCSALCVLVALRGDAGGIAVPCKLLQQVARHCTALQVASSGRGADAASTNCDHFALCSSFRPLLNLNIYLLFLHQTELLSLLFYPWKDFNMLRNHPDCCHGVDEVIGCSSDGLVVKKG